MYFVHVRSRMLTTVWTLAVYIMLGGNFFFLLLPGACSQTIIVFMQVANKERKNNTVNLDIC